MDSAFSMCGSVKPPESVSGRYFVVFTMKKCSNIYPPLVILSRLCQKLEEIVKMIEETSLMEVSGQIAIYGYISCIRMILAESNEYLNKTKEYRELCGDLINICFKLDHIFFPLLGCAAPEGTLIGNARLSFLCFYRTQMHHLIFFSLQTDQKKTKTNLLWFAHLGLKKCWFVHGVR